MGTEVLSKPKVFFISDLHLFHNRILEFGRDKWFKTLDEMHLAILTNWNSVVKPKDKVYVLGDVALNITEENEQNLQVILTALNGTKVLVAGNHDNAPNKLKIYREVFKEITGCIEYKDAILTHIPVHSSQLEHRWKYNIHGHLHEHFVGVQKMDGVAKDERYRCVSCEQVEFTPRTYEELIKTNG